MVMIKATMSNIISTMNANDRYCQGASQQMANGFYRVFDALEYIANDLDESKANAAKIRSIRTLLDTNNSYCQGAPQQAANGSYRIVEILQIIIAMLDKNNAYSAKTQSIISTMNTNNSYCQGAPQQTANGSYRIVDMLEILTDLLAPNKKTAVAAYISTMNLHNSYCQGAPQQSANGTDTAFCILKDLVSELDVNKRYQSQLENLVTLKARNNAYCRGADQQSANNIYRIMETIQVLGDIIHDQEQERIKAYWAAHSDEHKKLTDEKADCQKAIRDIEAKAKAVNADDEIRPIQQEIKVLETEKNSCGAKELSDLRAIVNKAVADRDSISIFRFRMRKEAQLKVDEANVNYGAQERKVNTEKTKIQNKIDASNNKIKALNKKVQDEKDAILKDCRPYSARIEKIDSELNRKR